MSIKCCFFYYSMKQKEEKAIRLEDHVYEMTKPLARSKNDQDLDTMLKDQERADDPMLTFIKKKKLKGLEKKGDNFFSPVEFTWGITFMICFANLQLYTVTTKFLCLKNKNIFFVTTKNRIL